jgi:ankyrin repeat protein
MSRKRSPIFRVIAGLLSIGLVLFLSAAACSDGTEDKNWELVKAAEQGRVDELLRLLASGADVRGVIGGNYTALMAAAHFRQLDAAKKLLDKGADVNVVAADGQTALMCAAQ